MLEYTTGIVIVMFDGICTNMSQVSIGKIAPRAAF